MFGLDGGPAPTFEASELSCCELPWWGRHMEPSFPAPNWVDMEVTVAHQDIWANYTDLTNRPSPIDDGFCRGIIPNGLSSG